jgi:hypothetical protein
MLEGYKICFKWHTNVKLRNADYDNCIDREEREISITMHAVINRRAARRDRDILTYKVKTGEHPRQKGSNITIHAFDVNRTAAETRSVEHLSVDNQHKHDSRTADRSITIYTDNISDKAETGGI